jgi:20S proteasome alpha/beta subunit
MASRYNRAFTVFSLNMHLLHVRYAQEAFREGSTVVNVNGKGVIVFSVQKKSVAKLQAYS